MVTLFDVARLAGVSTATVSRVVHGQDRVREATRIRVQQAIEELGYVPDGAAQSLSRRRKDVIGLVCVERQAQQYDIENMNLLFYDEVLRGVEARIRDHDWSLLITFLQRRDTTRISLASRSFSGKVDGILIGEGIVPSPFLERLAARVPVVVIAGTPDERAADVVTADNLSGSAAMVTHLIRDHGKRRLFWVDGPPDSPDSGERRLGLEHVLRANPQCQLVGSYQGYLQRPERRGGGRAAARHAPRGPAGRGRVRQRPDGHRGPQGPEPGRASGCLTRWPWSASTTSSPAACASPRSPPCISRCACWASGPAPALLDRIANPGLRPHRGAAADRTRAAVELRLPARHR